MTNCKKCNDSGIVEQNGKMKECICVGIKRARRIYFQTDAPKKNFCFYRQLKTENYVKTQTGEIPYKNLLKIFIENIDTLKTQNQVVFLVGETNKGKTLFCNILQTEIAYWRGYESVFIDERDIGNWIFSAEKKNKIRQSIKTAPLVIIDDLGISGVNKDNVAFNQKVVDEMDWILRNAGGLVLITSNKQPGNIASTYQNCNTNSFVSSMNKREKKGYIFHEDLKEQTNKRCDSILP